MSCITNYAQNMVTLYDIQEHKVINILQWADLIIGYINLAHANNGTNKELRPVDIFCNQVFNSSTILLDGYIFCPGKCK